MGTLPHIAVVLVAHCWYWFPVEGQVDWLGLGSGRDGSGKGGMGECLVKEGWAGGRTGKEVRIRKKIIASLILL